MVFDSYLHLKREIMPEQLRYSKTI
jgi:hypothetical protein